jgi:hypothetical protein
MLRDMHYDTQIRLDAFSRRKSSTDSLASVSSLQLTLPPTLPRHNSAPYNSATMSASQFDKCYNSAGNGSSSSSSHYNSAVDSSSKLSPAAALLVSQPQHAHTTAAEAHAAIRKRPKKLALIEDMAPVAEGVPERLSSSQKYQSPLSQYNTRFQLKRHSSEQQTVRPLGTMTHGASAADVSTSTAAAAAAVVECDVEESSSGSESSEGASSSDVSDAEEDCGSDSSSSSVDSSEEDIEELILSLRTNKYTVQEQQQQQQQQQQQRAEQDSDTAITSTAAHADVTASQQHSTAQNKLAGMVAIPSADPDLLKTTAVQHVSSTSTDDDVSEVTSGERESSFNSSSSSGSNDSRNSSNSSTSTEDDCGSNKGSVRGCASATSSPCSTAFPVHDGEQLDAALSFDTDASSSDSDSNSASSIRSLRSNDEHSSTAAADTAAAQHYDGDTEVCEYRGNPAYAALCVADHLQLYFREHVFAENSKSSSYTNSLPLLRMTSAVRAARVACGTPTRETLRSLFKETVMPYESSNSSNISSTGSSSSSSGSSGARVQQQQQHMKDALTNVVSYRDLSGAAAGTMTGETPALLIITNVCLYIVAASGLGDGQAFFDAPLPTVLACMPTADLDKVVLTFGLQKLRLVFSSVHLQSMPATTKSQRRASLGNTSSSSSSSSGGSQAVAAVQHKHASASSIVAATVCFEVVVLTRSPTRTHALIAVLEPLVNDVRRSRGLSPMLLENEDNVLLDAVGQLVAAKQHMNSSGSVTDTTAAAAAANKAADVMLYQLLFQRYPVQRPWVLAPRSLIVTRSELLLCDEHHAGQYTAFAKTETDNSSGSSVTAEPVQLLHCLARARLSDVIDVSLEPAVAGQLVISLRARGVLQTKRHWLLQCRTASSAEKIVAELKRLSKAARSKGSTLSLVNTALKDFVL